MSESPNTAASGTSTGFSTQAIHAGQEVDQVFGAVVPPVHFSTTYAPDGIGNLRNGYDYGRAGNPTRTALQTQLAALEGGGHAFSFGSGLAAEDAVIRALLRPGQRIVMGNDAYGGSFRLFDKVHSAWGVANTPLDLSDHTRVAAELENDDAALLWVETPSNPLMAVTDITALADIAHAHGALLVVDNTFATPYLQQPLSLGADVVVHSTTKYIGGHSDVVGGAVVLGSGDAADDLAGKIAFQQFAVGAVSGPLDAYLTTRGLKTLGVRMDRHCANAQTIAEHFQDHPAIEKVLYPGLASHPQHELAKSQMRSFGGMVSIQLTGGEPAARKVAEATRFFILAESLGGVESLMNYPHEMTHASVRGTELAVPENLLRLSVGIEDVADLIDDLERALGGL
ncbi:cystathionine gamma-synthase [Nesterenkonia alkaliphila]|uniref:Cystathionine gamma-synthase n=1 Tax=Nesterenkonia alkaliphila TaxID=1463631 RepID=A0A7K1ULB9_9MICC|nr:cystathionine gamma-synthase [Nesterenkonia alkaliphila]MVT27263.1 cystathionine gamma-synthase [Nesterenkonia alkaliphila]GFZ78227.1 cystathionine gamma-synthase [Nesterenkonia alkaliphila]